MSGTTIEAIPTDMSTADVANNIAATPSSVPICKFFLRGICRFGSECRFSHSQSGGEVISNNLSESNACPTENNLHLKPSTSRVNWINAPVFVPKNNGNIYGNDTVNVVAGSAVNYVTDWQNECANVVKKSWADIVGNNNNNNIQLDVTNIVGSIDEVCPYVYPCPFDKHCVYAIHFELCKMCDQYCLHPNDPVQRRKHNQECLEQHENAMELSFAIARSKDKTCGICFDTIMEKSGREKRFGILPNCSHIFCLECIRKWRQAKQFEHKIKRSCPECRVCSDFVCPSAFWVETKEEKDKLLNDYRNALGIKDCKYFKKGEGKCPFGNKCFYKHALPNGELVDVGLPRRARKMQNSTSEIFDLLDIYLWEYVDHRDFHWLDVISLSDDSSESDFSD